MDNTRPDRGPVTALLSILAVIAAIASGCATAAEDSTWVGGPVTPSSLTISAAGIRPVGDPVPTGIVVDGAELVLIIEDTYQTALETIWRDTTSGAVTRDHPRRQLGSVSAEGGHAYFHELAQLDLGNGHVVDLGDIRSSVERIQVTDHGRTLQAKFTSWSHDPGLVIFWAEQKGDPISQNSQVDVGHSVPLEPDRYPLVTAYARGTTIEEARIRPPATSQK
jgi:hypothetical protein